MSEAFLQVLLMLAYLAIGLISVTFPIYAICATYLKQEKWESEKERKNRMGKLRVKISKLTAELKGEEQDSKQVTQIKEQIEKYENELEGIELGVRYLTAEGAVRNPIIGLALALVAAGAGIHFFYEGSQQNVAFCGCASGILSALALLNLYKTISAVEYACLRPARTVEFDVSFGISKEKTKTIKLGKKYKLGITAKTAEDNVEDFTLVTRIPAVMELSGEAAYEGLTITKHPEYTFVSLYKKFLPKEVGQGVRLCVIPKQAGQYKIPVIIYAKGIYECNKELVVDIVK